MSARPIFRQSALEAYRRGTEKAVMPRVVSWPSTVFFWSLLGALIAATVIAWSVRVPTYVGGSGVILGHAEQRAPAGARSTAVLFLAPGQATHLRMGRPVHLQVGFSGAYIRGTVAKVGPGVIGPDAARTRYGGSNLITRPSAVVVVKLDRQLPPAVYGGSRITGRVEIGSRRLIGLLSGFNHLGRGNS